MDPQVAYNGMLAAYGRGDWAECLVYGQALMDWLDKGGFPPVVSGLVPQENTTWHAYIARWVAGTTFGFARRASQGGD